MRKLDHQILVNIGVEPLPEGFYWRIYFTHPSVSPLVTIELRDRRWSYGCQVTAYVSPEEFETPEQAIKAGCEGALEDWRQRQVRAVKAREISDFVGDYKL